MAYQVPLKYNPVTAVHEPMSTSDDKVALSVLPISPQVGNTLQTRPDGLYTGGMCGSPVLYVSSTTGNDANGAGGAASNPMRTLEYALNYLRSIASPGGFREQVIIALKAGDTFTHVESFYLFGGQVTLTFYGDPKYGDWTGTYSGGVDAAFAAYASDLQRPVINCTVASGTSGGSPGFVLLGNEGFSVPSATATVVLFGVRLNLPSSTHLTGQIDYVGIEGNADGRLILRGAVVNLTNTASIHGLVGVDCASQASLYQFASQFLVEGQQVVAGASVAALQARKYFIKMYPDFAGNHQNGYTLENGSPGSALLQLSWSDVASLAIGANTNQATYPVLNNPSYGLANYIFNLTRDQQSRPLNVISGRLF